MTITEILSKYEVLGKGFKYIIENSKSNHLPYHNLNHCLTVMKNCYDGSTDLDFNDYFIEELLLAALFHDVNHSGGLLTDDLNVENAKLAVTDFLQKEKIDYLDENLIDNIIDATQYPYIIKSSFLTTQQAIIRDADLMQIYETDFITQHLMGLSQEMKIPFNQIVIGVKEFLETTQPITSWAQKVHEDKWPSVVRKLYSLDSILNK